MSEKIYDTKVFEVDYACDNCNSGLMINSGTMLPSYPPQYPHKCKHCGLTKNLLQKYPTIRYERTLRQDTSVVLPLNSTGDLKVGVTGTANICRKLNLQVGDTIEGRDTSMLWWNVTRLTLLWLGTDVVVWNERHISSTTGGWTELREATNWSLETRKWNKVESTETIMNRFAEL